MTSFVVELCGGCKRRLLKTEEPLVTISDLAPGTAYEVRIAATSDGGQGEVLSGRGRGRVGGLATTPILPCPSLPLLPFSGPRCTRSQLDQSNHLSHVLWPLWGSHGNTV